MHVDAAGQLPAGEVDEQPAREHRRRLGEMRVDALLPAIGAVRAECETLRRAHDPERLEVRRLEQHLRRVVAHLAVEAAHDRRQGNRALAVGDQQVALVELPQRAVEGRQLLARPRPAHDDAAARELRPVERVQRAAVDVHHVVRHVDDVGDGAHAGRVQARTHPHGRRADRDALEDTREIPRTASGVVDGHVDPLGMLDLRVGDLDGEQLAVAQGGDLAGEADHREQVDAVHRRGHVQHLLAHRQDVDERRARLDPVRQHHDPGVVGTEADLVLGEDHPARHLAAQRALVERAREPGQQHAGQAHRHGRAGTEVPGAADDLARLRLAHVDLAELQLVGIRVLHRLDDLAHAQEREVVAGVGDADVDDAVDLEGGDREAPCDLLGRGVDADVLAQPGEGSAHQNCLEKRRSLRHSSRRSGNSCRSIAIRSSPQPNAKPL